MPTPLSRLSILTPRSKIGRTIIEHHRLKLKQKDRRKILDRIKKDLEEVEVDYNKTRDSFIEKIRINHNADVSDSEIIAFRDCLKQHKRGFATSSKDLTNNFKQLLTA
ncbi:7913_t:CDS:2 [Diversispora eburnea]|uniref:7913_t:CDS:1 n=1 Tax=Diversispora eburnea TaxID=1213867 RepID=A0A9N9AB23_9GLOM|nr:7913_t:CDS:2 [Diversispora eburnea]